MPPRHLSMRVRRRRALAGLIAIVVFGFGVSRLISRGSSTPDAVAHSPTAIGSPTVDSPPAYLAWTSGGFPDAFRQTVELPAARRLVVVAGDTRWLTASENAQGDAVDRPAPLMIPIDAFAVDPAEYAPFLPDDVREKVTEALRAGKGVLGERSAALRRLGVGGTLHFGDVTIQVGAVVPDDAIGWSELLVSRTVAKALGIVHDRYLLADIPSAPTENRFEAMIAKNLPADTLIRVAAPGTTRFVRVASGVNPPIVLKEVFGEFAAKPQQDDPAVLDIDQDWANEHMATREVPLLGRVTCNKALFPQLVAALTEIRDKGLSDLIHVYSGCWAARTVARSPTAPPSTHAYGAAIDINAPENPYGSTPTMDHRIVRIFERWGFIWGGRYLIPDGQHFEYGGPPSATT